MRFSHLFNQGSGQLPRTPSVKFNRSPTLLGLGLTLTLLALLFLDIRHIDATAVPSRIPLTHPPAKKSGFGTTATTTPPVGTAPPTAIPTPCAGASSLTEGFESGSLGVFGSSGTPGWSLVSNVVHSGYYAAFAPDVHGVSDQQLTLLAPLGIPASTTRATLSFWHRYDFEQDYDGGVLEISTDGGSSWLDAGSIIIAGRYNGTISTCCLNPLNGRPAWVGANTGFTAVAVNLLPYAGQTIRFRFRLGTDELIAGNGWWIDDILLTIGQSTCGTATPTVTGTPPTATPTATATLTATPSATLTPTPTPTPICAPHWSIINGLNSGGGRELRDVAVIAPNDIWTVGSGWQDSIQHWDGVSWSTVPSPYVGRLMAITMVAPNNLWAVGGGILHWDGTVWHEVYNLQGVGELYGVDAVAPDDIWAAGISEGSSNMEILLVHWNGSAWSVVPGPTPPGIYSEFYDLDALGPNDVWAVGYYNTAAGKYTLTAHWDGTAWSIIPSPNGSTAASSLWGVAALAPNNVWAVGEIDYGLSDLIMHWDGMAWSIIPSRGNGGLHDLAVFGPADIWAVGSINRGEYTLTEHWDGTNWTPVSSPNQSTYNELWGAAAAGTSDVWAVGSSDFMGAPLMERYGTRFADVPARQPFYPFIEWMACAGTISGYQCGAPHEPCDPALRPYFRPGTNVTRGQLLKMVVDTAGWPLVTPPAPTFADVPSTDPFYSFIETGAARGVINGYACGGPGEPCDPQNRPYFRPGNDITRGQLSKVVTLARGYAIPNPPIPTFADVPGTHPFFGFIEAVYTNGVVSGYTCGGPGEPCDPGNRPYFRAPHNATRGQVAKIVTVAYGGPLKRR